MWPFKKKEYKPTEKRPIHRVHIKNGDIFMTDTEPRMGCGDDNGIATFKRYCYASYSEYGSDNVMVPYGTVTINIFDITYYETNIRTVGLGD